jgi:hypothetical protein
MANMGYCRFQNTLEDLRDCYEHIDKPVENNEEEEHARQRLIKLCGKIAEATDEDEDDEDEKDE